MITAYFKRAQQVILWVILTSFGCVAMSQTILHFDSKKQANQQMMETLYVKTIVCMRTATQAMLREGSRDAEQVIQFNISSCGRPLYMLLTKSMGWTEEDGMSLLIRLSELTLKQATT
jgi:hypothetical protein